MYRGLLVVVVYYSTTKAYIHDALSTSILPHIDIKPATSGDHQIIFAPSDGFKISPTTYELSCNHTENLIEFYDTRNDLAIVAISKEDYQSMLKFCIFLPLSIFTQLTNQSYAKDIDCHSWS